MDSVGFSIRIAATAGCGTTAIRWVFIPISESLVAGRLSVIVLCNRTDLDPEELARRVADVYLTSPVVE